MPFVVLSMRFVFVVCFVMIGVSCDDVFVLFVVCSLLFVVCCALAC